MSAKHINLRRGYNRTPRVALIVETTRAYGRDILEGIALYIRQNEPWLVHVAPRSLPDPVLPWLKKWKGDGIIARVSDPKSARILAATGMPIVNLKGTSETCLGPAAVANDHYLIGRMAAGHFLDRGFKKFAFIGIPGFAWSDRRFDGFAACVREKQCDCVQYTWRSPGVRKWRDGLLEEEIDAIAAWINRQPKPLGVMAADDFLGVQLLSSCRYLGVRVPDEVAVVGVDNDETVCLLGCPPLSSVEPDNHRVGFEAARLLASRMRGTKPPEIESTVPPLRVVVRQSSDVSAITNPQVTKAMAFIREHVAEGIDVSDVLKHVGLSRTALQNHFRSALNRSIHDIIVDIRVARVKELLAESSLPLKAIADRCGFRHPEHLHEVFKRVTGFTPTRFRRQDLWSLRGLVTSG